MAKIFQNSKIYEATRSAMYLNKFALKKNKIHILGISQSNTLNQRQSKIFKVARGKDTLPSK